MSEWASAATPLAGLKVLDLARWDWLKRHGAYFTFGDDELAAYAAKLMLLGRWNRIEAASDEENAEAGDSDGKSAVSTEERIAQ